MLQRTLQLGISLLHGGNREVQKVKSLFVFFNGFIMKLF